MKFLNTFVFIVLTSASLYMCGMQQVTKNGITNFFVPGIFNGYGDNTQQCILDYGSGNVNCYENSNIRQPLNLDPRVARAMYFELKGRFAE